MSTEDLGLGLGLFRELESCREHGDGFLGIAPLDRDGPEVEETRDLGRLVPEGPADLQSLGQVVFRLVELSLGEVDGSNIVESPRFGQSMAGFTAQLEAFEMIFECLPQIAPSLVHGSKPGEGTTHTEQIVLVPEQIKRLRVALERLV